MHGLVVQADTGTPRKLVNKRRGGLGSFLAHYLIANGIELRGGHTWANALLHSIKHMMDDGAYCF